MADPADEGRSDFMVHVIDIVQVQESASYERLVSYAQELRKVLFEDVTFEFILIR